MRISSQKDNAVDDEIEDETEDSESTEDSEETKVNVTIHTGDKSVEYALNDEQIELVIKFIEEMNANK